MEDPKHISVKFWQHLWTIKALSWVAGMQK